MADTLPSPSGGANPWGTIMQPKPSILPLVMQDQLRRKELKTDVELQGMLNNQARSTNFMNNAESLSNVGGNANFMQAWNEILQLTKSGNPNLEIPTRIDMDKQQVRNQGIAGTDISNRNASALADQQDIIAGNKPFPRENAESAGYMAALLAAMQKSTSTNTNTITDTHSDVTHGVNEDGSVTQSTDTHTNKGSGSAATGNEVLRRAAGLYGKDAKAFAAYFNQVMNDALAKGSTDLRIGKREGQDVYIFTLPDGREEYAPLYGQ